MAIWDRIKPPTQDFKTLGSWAFNLLKPPVKDIRTIGRAVKPPVRDIATIGRALPYTRSPFEAYRKMTYEPAKEKYEYAAELKESFSKGLSRGWLLTGSVMERVASVGAKKVGWDEVSEKLDRLATADKELAMAGVNVTDTRKFSEKIKDPHWIVEGIGQNLPNMFVGMGAAIPAAVVGAPAIVIGGTAFLATASLEGGFAYEDALDFGVDKKEAEKVAGIVGVANGILETLPITKLLTRSPVGKKIKRSLIREITKRVVQQSVLESGTESLQEIVSNAVATTYDENKGLLEGVPESAFFGGIMGGGVSLTMDVAGRVTPGLTIEDVSKPSDRLLETMRRPTEPKVEPLVTEARKYKSAEEFVRKADIFPESKIKETIYHGTAKKFDIFSDKYIGENQQSDFGEGFYFTDKKHIAKSFAKDAGGDIIMEVSLDIKNPAKNKDLLDMEIQSAIDDEMGFKDVGDVLKEKGFDGIEFTHTDGSVEYVVFNANQIKTKSQLTDIYNKAKALPEAKKVTLPKRITPKVVKEFVGKKPAPFIKKRETTLLKERIKKIQKSAMSEANKKVKIQKLKDEFKIRLKKTIERERLRTLKVSATERIKGIAKGVRESRVLTKKEITKTQTEIVDILDKSKLERSDKAKFIRAIKNVQTTEQLKKALPEIQARIEKLSEEVESKTIIKKIQKAIKVTVVKGKKPKGKYTPEIQNVLNSIKKLTDLNQKKANEKIEDNLKEYAVKMPVEIAVENHLLSLYTGTSKQKQELLNIINQLKEEGEVASSLKKFNIQADIERKSELVVSRVTSDKGIEEGRLRGEPADKTKVQKVKQYLKAVGKKTILDWRGLMTTLDFNSSVKVKPLADFFSVSKNESKYKELQSKYIESFNEAVSSIYGVKNKPNSILKIVNKMTTEKVKVGEYEYTRDELIKRHMEIQDPTLIESLERGNKFTEKTFKDIEDKITENDKKFAQWQLEYYQKMYSKVNEICSKMNGVDLPFNEFYSPIRRVGYQVEPGHTEFMDEAFYRKAVTSKSLISRIKNLNPILKQGSLSVLDRHITDTNYYIAWAEKIRELDSVFTNNEVREAIKQEFPSSLLESINTKIQHISTHGNKTASRIGWVDYIRKSYVVGNLAVKPALTIKQLVSTLAYAEKISAKDLTVGILDFAKNPIKNYQTLKNESWFIKMRGAGMERDIRDAIKEGVFDRYNKRQNLANSLLLNVKLGDKGAIVLGSWAMRRARLKAGIPLQDVINEYEEFSADTQQSADISRLSEIQLGGSLEKLFTVFKSSQRAYLQKETNAIKSLFRQDGFGKDNVKRVAKVMFIYHILLPVTFQWISNMGGWDEDDKKDYQRAAIWGSLNGLFIAGDVIGAIISQVMGMRVWDIDVLVVDIGDDINKAISNLTEEDVDIEDIQTALDALASATTSLSGLPVEYSYDILESLYNGNYETAMKQILGWSEYVIGEEKTAYEEAVSAQKKKEKEAKEKIGPKYEEIQRLKKEDRLEASKIYRSLSAEEKKAYKSIKRSEEAKRFSGKEEEIYPVYLEITEMKETDYQKARKMYTDLSKEDRRVYQKIKTKLE